MLREDLAAPRKQRHTAKRRQRVLHHEGLVAGLVADVLGVARVAFAVRAVCGSCRPPSCT